MVESTTTLKGAWRTTFLLFFFMLINFADKIVFGLAGVPIMNELKLPPDQFGFLGSAFFFLFSISAIIVGFIVNSVPTRWVLLLLALSWSVVQFPMVGSVGFTTLLICRILLGAGEGPAFSVAAHAIYKWVPDEKRVLATAILSQGSAFGAIVALPALSWVIENYSWHHAFGVLGVCGLIWVVLWWALGKEGPLEDKPEVTKAAESRIPYFRLLTCPTFIGSCLSTFGAYWALSLGLTWFTPFIIRGLGFTQQQAGFLSALPWIFGAFVVLMTGWMSQRMMRQGYSTRYARGLIGTLPLLGGGLLLALMPYVPTPSMQMTLLVVGSGLCGAMYVVGPPMIGEFTPISQRGAMIAIYGAVYTLAGMIAPYIMGSMLQRSSSELEGYMFGFTVNGIVMIVAALAGLLLLWPNAERDRFGRMTAAPAEPKAQLQRS